MFSVTHNLSYFLYKLGADLWTNQEEVQMIKENERVERGGTCKRGGRVGGGVGGIDILHSQP